MTPRQRVPGGVPALVLQVLADGQHRNLKQVVDAVGDLRPELDGWTAYASVATALTALARDGKLQREKVRGRYAYWRGDVAEAAS